MDLVPTVVVGEIDLACAGPCRSLVGAFAVLVADGSPAVAPQHPAVRERRLMIAAQRARQFSYSRRPPLVGQCRLRNQTGP